MAVSAEKRNIIYNRFLANIVSVPQSRITFENEVFTPPVQDTWIRLSVRSLDNKQTSLGRIGNRRFTVEGLVLVQAFAPTDSGLKVLNSLADEIVSIFNSTKDGTIIFKESQIREQGTEESWSQFLIETPFYYERLI